MAARPIATGTISFGLVAIPVQMFSSTESGSRVQFNSIHESCGTRVRQRLYCPTHDALVSREELVKGYEFAKDQYVIFEPDELKAMELSATHSIDIKEFVPVSAVDPIYFEKAYYLGPATGGDKPYVLLAEVMKKTGRAALAKYAARGKDYLVLLRPYEDGLIMQQLRYDTELRAFEEVVAPDVVVNDTEMALATQIVDQISSDLFTPELYTDSVTSQVLTAIEQKVEGHEFTLSPSDEPRAQVIDLMEALKASLGQDDDAQGEQTAASAGA
ncbi:MAG: Ku protein [Actinomycetota bacterium]|jgi:DNA end-binding protein Ku|nr:Ku protein [Actinomycetota bacterium]